jgi:hypothetical protein
MPSFSAAATFTVANTNDSGAGSLREAIDSSNSHHAKGPLRRAFCRRVASAHGRLRMGQRMGQHAAAI